MGASVCRHGRSLLPRHSRAGHKGSLMGGDDSLDGLDRQEDIAQFPYVEFTGRDSITCPTCQGSGRIPSGQLNELVALIPYSDQRLQPRRTKLYVVLSVILCLLASVLVAFFLFPRPVLVVDDGIRSVTVHFDRNNSKVLINMTSTLNVTNSNFFTVLVDSVSCQVLYMKTVIGSQQLDNVIHIQPLSQRQVNFTVKMEIGGSLSYVYAFCTMASIKVHNIVVFMQTSVKTSYMVRAAQNTLEAYRYIDCGANSTIHKPSGMMWSKPLAPQNGKLLRRQGCWNHSRMSEAVVSGVRRLSTISEQDMDAEAEPVSPRSPEDSEWAGSSASLCSHGKPSGQSSTFSSFESYQPDAADDCASILLACLYCRFCDIMAMLPDTCERAFGRCFPSYKYYSTSDEPAKGKDWCSCNVDFDCGFMNSCQEASELIELAMEISEVCYR
ncbi:hypothetical protein Q8A67_016743 [Cirrhinus molitorella]|uniref:Transmembrane protein 106C n=1 Tax=Cirrhinus molitorella TaxID=172907 RepID=A0AA88PDH0_9TELE|nr:hypothetical protein Q8A67_016743 [Cirrhinus molitorella]